MIIPSRLDAVLLQLWKPHAPHFLRAEAEKKAFLNCFIPLWVQIDC